jgi:GWxTD domain-containing protein
MVASLALALAITGAMSFSVDWAAFRAGADSSRVDFFYAIPHDQLLYVDSAGECHADFTVAVEVKGLGSDFKQAGAFRKHARLGPGGFAEAVIHQRAFVDAFSVTVPAGRFSFRVDVTDSTPSGVAKGTYQDSLAVAGFTTSPSLSSLQLGAALMSDTATGALAVIPNPSRRFGVRRDTVYFYYEGYGLAPDTSQYGLEVWVVRRGRGQTDTAVRSGLLIRDKRGGNVSSAFGLSVKGLERGVHTLMVAITDLTTHRSAGSERDFFVATAADTQEKVAPRLEGMGERERRYYREVQYLTTPKQHAFYEALSDSGKEAFLASFWAKHNLTEFARRMEYVEQKYRRPRDPGVKTDRGRVYVKYGEPDAIEQKVIETDLRPREYWHYYGTGYVFIFIDIRGDGNYRLAYTSSREEPPTGLEQYLSPEEADEFNTDR